MFVKKNIFRFGLNKEIVYCVSELITEMASKWITVLQDIQYFQYVSSLDSCNSNDASCFSSSLTAMHLYIIILVDCFLPVLALIIAHTVLQV